MLSLRRFLSNKISLLPPYHLKSVGTLSPFLFFILKWIPPHQQFREPNSLMINKFGLKPLFLGYAYVKLHLLYFIASQPSADMMSRDYSSNPLNCRAGGFLQVFRYIQNRLRLSLVLFQHTTSSLNHISDSLLAVSVTSMCFSAIAQ